MPIIVLWLGPHADGQKCTAPHNNAKLSVLKVIHAQLFSAH